MKPHHLALLAATAAMATGSLAVSSQSLWIDEAGSAILAIRTDPLAFMTDRGSTLQMPLYMLMLWAWEKVFGHSELALRAMNIPLFAASLLIGSAFWVACTVRRVFFILFACSSAFLWAYLDEARPYILQFLGATACAISLANLAGSASVPRRSGVILFTAGILILGASSLLGVISVFWFSTAFLLLWLMREPLSVVLRRPDFRLAIVLSMPTLLILAAFYAWTLSLGAKASSIGSTNLMSMGYCVYELLGVAGLGPGRGELRSSSSSLLAFVPAILVYVFILAAFLCLSAVFGCNRISYRNWRRGSLVFWLAPIAVAATTTLVGMAGDFRVVGRHLTPVLPFLLILLAVAAGILWEARPRAAMRGMTILVGVAMTISAIGYRMLERHAKDDYRSAASLARLALQSGGSIWWAADQSAAHFYGLETIVPDGRDPAGIGRRGAFMANNRDMAYLARLPQPSLVILSKIDIYDRASHLRRWLAENEYTLTERKASFEFYTLAHSAN